MSDTETEETQADAVIEYIESAVEDLRVTNDYISYATVLEVNLENPARFSDSEKAEILEKLNEVLVANLDIVEEIGWDIPNMILPFFDLEWNENTWLAEGIDALKANMRLFETVARYGNPKEVFIKSIELLTSIDYSDNDTPKKERVLDIKFYALLELLASSLKRINTIYPSKFLGMALTCLIGCFVKYNDSNAHQRFISRKLYAFARDYIPPMKPLDWLKEHGITQAEANKLDDDENYLQRKLLQSFITQISALSSKAYNLGLANEKYLEVKMKGLGKVMVPKEKTDESMTSTRDAFARYVGLAISFDIDFDVELNKLKEDSVKLMEQAVGSVKEEKAKEKQQQDQKQDEDENDLLIQATVGLSLNDHLKYSYHPDQTIIPLSPSGFLNLSTQYVYEERFRNRIPQASKISLLEALSIHVRFLSPALISKQLSTRGILDSVLYWDWCAVMDAKPSEYKLIPKYIRVLFLQSTIYFACTDPDAEVRFILFTLMVRLLAHIEEDEAYSFIVDTLATAPLENAKAGVVNVLKDFLIRERPVVTDEEANELSDALGKTTIKDDDDHENTDKKTNSPPSLPKRHFIELTTERIDTIYALTRECLDEAFAGDAIEGGRFKTLLGYLNLLIGIKKRFPQDLLSEIVTLTKKHLASDKKCDDESTNVEFANVAIESLSDYIRQLKQT